jgi:4-hydroxy-tetrahydrodipicolinate reductase
MPGVAIFGVTGRMGQCLLRALAEQGDSPDSAEERLTLSGALASAGSPLLGAHAAGAHAAGATAILITSDLRTALEGAAVALDFSHPHSLPLHLEACLDTHTPLLVGTTGLEPAALAAIEAAAARIAVLVAPNTSLGVAVLTRLTSIATRALGGSSASATAIAIAAPVDIEISETHHRAKRDAPSGTALALGAAVAAVRGVPLEALAVRDRAAGAGPRAASSIGFSSRRAGDVVGEHTVLFAGSGEQLELTHRATDRMVFARGALAAARWLIGRPPGRYGMADVLGV